MRRISPQIVPLTAAALVLSAGSAFAQRDAEVPAATVLAAAPAAPSAAPSAAPVLKASQPAGGRKVLEGPPTKLAFKGVTVEQIVPFIVEATGKVVMPQQDIMTKRITVLNDKEIPRNQALDLVLLALQQNGIAVVETATTVTLRDLAEITRQDVPVLGPDESVLDREDLGTIASKVYRLRNSQAKNYGDILKNLVPDYAKIIVDEDSNQIAIMGNIALLQRLEQLIGALDQPPSGALRTETFRLRYADADKVTQNIQDLFSPNAVGGAGNRPGGQQGQNRGRGPGGGGNQQQPVFRFPGQPGDNQAASGTSQTLRVSANEQQNSVTVVADPSVLDQIREQIEKYWDTPLKADQVVPKVYSLKYTDPVKVRALLEGLFGRPSTTGGTGGGGGGGGGGGQPVGTASGPGVGRLAGQFSFQSMPEAGKLVVVSKSPDNLIAIDEIIAKIDEPQTAGLPAIIELKHANAEDLADQINTLLSQEGTIAQLQRSANGLATGTSAASPFASNASSTTTTDQNGNTTTNNTATAASQIAFWWQRARPPTDREPNSNLIGQVRIVPVWRQNAVMVMAPPEYKQSIVGMISDLDRPGRQVLISALVVEVERDDATELGLRWSSQTITPTNPDNSVSIATSSTNTKNNFLPSLFDTSVLNANVNLNVILQALSQKTAISILSEPKIFTSDNQEADFFSGQDIPFITQSTVNSVGSPTQSFDYKAVGIQLRARPRITQSGNVDLTVNVELASIEPGNTLFGGAIIDRRETTTQLIVKNAQTVVISGILRKSDTDVVRKVPLLGDIPLIGAIFRSMDRTKTNTELLVFITPLVVENDDDMATVNKPYLQRLKERQNELQETTPNLPAGSEPAHEAVPKEAAPPPPS